MNAVILTMRIENFKGVQSMRVDFDGKNTSVYGRNATGKTSLFDAFTWCLFGKDSADRTDFWCKPHDVDGNEIHNLETYVEVNLSVDGQWMCFGHKMVEKWVKKNGQTDRVFSGNTHKYWVNSVSVSASEYSKSVEQIVKPDVFRLITNPMAFNNMKWDKRREFLVQLCKADIDGYLLAMPKYAALAAEMKQRATDAYGVKKVLTERKKSVNAELTLIPARISELMNMITQMGECDTQAAKQRIEMIDAELKVLNLASTDGADVVEAIQKAAQELADAEGKKQAAIAKMEKDWIAAGSQARMDAMAVKAEASMAERAVAEYQRQIDMLTKQLEEAENHLKEMRKEWYRVSEEKQPEAEVETVCPACGQDLPMERVEEARKNLAEHFLADKKARLAKVSADGKTAAASVKNITAAKADAERSYQDALKKSAELTVKLDALEAEAKQYTQVPIFSAEPAVQAIQQVVDAKRAKYEQVLTQKKTPDAAIENRKQDLWNEKTELAKVDANREQKEVCEKRIAEIEKRQEELGIQVADTERFLMVIEDFITDCCKALEENVNSMFPSVKWRLFEVQINGGIKDCCECLVGGIQFASANNSAKINAGLEIIGVLSKHYGVTVPVFVDNAEAVNELMEIDSQRIALVVTDDDTQLRIEGSTEK